MNRTAGSYRAPRARAIHIRRDPITGAFALVERATGTAGALQRNDRETEREWAEDTLYRMMSDANDPLARGLPLARERAEASESPRSGKVKIDSKHGGSQPSASTVRPRSDALPLRPASSLCSVYTPPLYHQLFCAHDRFRGEPCSACRRSAAEGREWIAAL